jgi:hypothetical protein
MENFDGGDGGLTPLAGAADDDAAIWSGEDFLLLGVGFEFEGFRGRSL